MITCHADQKWLPKAKLSVAEVGHHWSQWVLIVVSTVGHRLFHCHHFHDTVMVHHTTPIISSIRSGQLKRVERVHFMSVCIIPWHTMRMNVKRPTLTNFAFARPIGCVWNELWSNHLLLDDITACPRQSRGHSLNVSLDPLPFESVIGIQHRRLYTCSMIPCHHSVRLNQKLMY